MITEQQISSQNLPYQRAAITETTRLLLIYFYEFLGAFQLLQKSITRLKKEPILAGDSWSSLQNRFFTQNNVIFMVTVAILIKVAKKSWKLWKYFVYKSCILDRKFLSQLIQGYSDRTLLS